VLEWLREMLGLPADFEGVIADRASTASLLAIAAARDAVAPEIGALGMAGCGGMPKLRLYSSEQAHWIGGLTAKARCSTTCATS
jgi:aromatic-L-amino-acid decarboxylase